MSSLEVAVGDFLDSKEIEYDAQVAIRNPENGQYFACVDFLLANGSVIEVYGSYWHADPRVYKLEEMNGTQQQIVRKDGRKQEILHQLQIPFVILWERDLAANLEATVEEALVALGSLNAGTA